jgi:glutaminyl-tRNA synthetase
LQDSLENVTHSLCTLEFEIRRDSYYWLLEALDIYRPFVWEYSRLNLTRNVLSKRRLQKLVETKLVRGWDDPRLLTLNGLRRRGYTATAINDFVDRIGVTRRGNENIISIGNLESSIRRELDKSAPRSMAVLKPLKVTFENLDSNFSKNIETHLFPKDPSQGSKNITLSKVIYIEHSDFREVDDPNFFGLALNKETGLKYAGLIKCTSVVKNEKNEVIELKCNYSDEQKKTKGRIHWISDKDSHKSEVRVYDYLFKSENPGELENYLDDLNPNSLVVRDNALIHKSLLNDVKTHTHFQFERHGYFVLDNDSNVQNQQLVFNLTVSL